MDEAERRLATQVKRLREARGLSQEELAAEAGTSPQTVSRIERASVSPDFKTIVGLQEALDVTFDQLFGAGGSRRRPASLEPRLRRLARDAERVAARAADALRIVAGGGTSKPQRRAKAPRRS